MRILVATDQWDPDVTGGSARVATGTSIQLARAGHDVSVIAPRTPGEPSLENVHGLQLHRVIRRSAVPQTVGDVFEVWRSARGLPRPDLLVSHQATVATGLLLAQRGVPLLNVFHASVTLEERFIRRHLRGPARLRNALLDPMLVLLERIAVRRADAVAVLSEYSARLVRDRHPGAAGRLVRVRGGLDLARFVDGDGSRGRALADVPDGVPFLLTVRRLEPRMGVEELLRAVSVLGGRGTTVRLAVAGSGPIRARLEQLARELGVDDRVRFLGWVPDEDLPGLYAGADVFVLPTVAYEGFGISTIEALAAGTPVVGTPVGATPELLEPLDARLVARDPSPEGLADAIAAALEDLPPDISTRARDYARSEFAWEAAIEPWLAAVEAAANG